MLSAISVSEQRLLTSGLFLFLVGLLQGVAVPLFASPRLALSAHIAAVSNGLVLVVFSLVWPRIPATIPTAYRPHQCTLGLALNAVIDQLQPSHQPFAQAVSSRAVTSHRRSSCRKPSSADTPAPPARSFITANWAKVRL